MSSSAFISFGEPCLQNLVYISSVKGEKGLLCSGRTCSLHLFYGVSNGLEFVDCKPEVQIFISFGPGNVATEGVL